MVACAADMRGAAWHMVDVWWITGKWEEKWGAVHVGGVVHTQRAHCGGHVEGCGPKHVQGCRGMNMVAA